MNAFVVVGRSHARYLSARTDSAPDASLMAAGAEKSIVKWTSLLIKSRRVSLRARMKSAPPVWVKINRLLAHASAPPR